MNQSSFYTGIRRELQTIEKQGFYKRERLITSPQSSEITVSTNGEWAHVLNFCANNYLGLADDPRLIEAGIEAQARYGFGMASVRFICGTQMIHRELEHSIAQWLGFDDSILYAACFDANGGVFEPLLGPDDAIVSDALNHASIIDGIRLCRARRYRYKNSDMDALETQLKQARVDGARHLLIVTDGVFSMDGYIAKLPQICDLADKYGALTMVDDCHATGFIGQSGRGTAEYHNVMGRIDILTGTLGKALGGAMGGFTCARQEIIDLLRQRSRPYLFSNSLAPSLAGAGIRALELVKNGDDLRAKLSRNARRFRAGMDKAGFRLLDGEHPIIPVIFGETQIAQDMAAALMDEGVYVTGFFFPVVPRGKARIRTQMSAAHTPEQISQAIAAFIRVGKRLGVI